MYLVVFAIPGSMAGAAMGQDRTVLEKELRDSNLLSKVHELLQDSLPWVKYEPWQWFLNLGIQVTQRTCSKQVAGPCPPFLTLQVCRWV